MSSLFQRAETFGERTAVVDAESAFSYRQLLETSRNVASHLLAGESDLAEARVAFLAPPGFGYVATQWGIWRAGGVAVPLAASHPPPELDYVIEDSRASVVVAHPDFAERLPPLAEKREVRFLKSTAARQSEPSPLPEIEPDRRAMMLYTSGTTSKPKGVVTTHANVQAQVESLIETWEAALPQQRE